MKVKRIRDKYQQVVGVTGRALGIDAGYFVSGGFWGGIQQAVGLLSGLAIAYSFGHFTSQSMFGEYNLVISIISLMTIFSMPGMRYSLLRSIGQGFDNSLSQTFKIRFLWSLVGTPILLAVAWYYRILGSDVMPTILMTLALVFPLIYSLESATTFFVARKRFDLQAIYTSVSSVLTAFLVVASLLLTQSLWLILMGYFIGIILPLGLAYRRALSMTKQVKKDDKELRSYGYFLTGIQILPLITAHVSDIVLAGFLGVEALALYAVAVKFPGIVQKNLDVFFKPVVAKLAGQSVKEHRETFKKHFLTLILIGIGLYAILWFLSPMLIRIFYGQAYLETIRYARIYALSIVPLPLSWTLSNIIQFQKRRKVQVWLNTVFPLAVLGLYFLVIPRWQISGLIGLVIGDRFATLAVLSGVLLYKRKNA